MVMVMVMVMVHLPLSYMCGDDGDGDYDYCGDNTGYDIDDITFIIEMVMVNYCMICFYPPPFFSMFKFRN